MPHKEKGGGIGNQHSVSFLQRSKHMQPTNWTQLLVTTSFFWVKINCQLEWTFLPSPHTLYRILCQTSLHCREVLCRVQRCCSPAQLALREKCGKTPLRNIWFYHHSPLIRMWFSSIFSLQLKFKLHIGLGTGFTIRIVWDNGNKALSTAPGTHEALDQYWCLWLGRGPTLPASTVS